MPTTLPHWLIIAPGVILAAAVNLSLLAVTVGLVYVGVRALARFAWSLVWPWGIKR